MNHDNGVLELESDSEWVDTGHITVGYTVASAFQQYPVFMRDQGVIFWRPRKVG